MEVVLALLRRLLTGGDRRRARRSQRARARALDASAAELERFEAAFRCVPGPGRIVLARSRSGSGEPYWGGIRTADLGALRFWLTGSSGSGKSYLVLALLLQALTDATHPTSILVADFKGELAALLLDTVLPAIAHMRAGQEVLSRLRVIRPFDPDFLPALNVTLAEPGVPREAQAEAIAHALEDAVGSDLGSRMLHLYRRLVSLAIELELPLLVVLDWLQDPRRFAQDARRSRDPALRTYASSVLPRESKASIAALLARFDAFTFHRTTRLMLAAPTCVSFGDALAEAPSLAVLDFGNAPAGAERLSRFFGGLLLGRLIRSLLTRPVTDDRPPALVVMDEWQEGLRGAHDADAFTRLLTLVRYRRVGVVLANQQVAQLDPKVVSILRTNTSHEAAFRAGYQDARAFAHALALPPGTRRPSEARQALVEELTRLETREYLFWPKGSLRAQRVRSPRVDLAGLERRAAAAPEEVRRFIRQGIVALPREDLEAQLEAGERARAAVSRPVDLLANPEADDEGSPGLG